MKYLLYVIYFKALTSSPNGKASANPFYWWEKPSELFNFARGGVEIKPTAIWLQNLCPFQYTLLFPLSENPSLEDEVISVH